ncbi:amino acid adenylation domain-containing protein [Phaeobacter sp. HF9A]|uniref:amino acid adenylation domain-containing protein n=1 Tax=Phaeobacter sp. HF9A TaxID=2721561 RepID=UPI00142F7169|nr:amino acid adenylation domain-containing protein [Phaeobacter sp. HF9A]NIZ12297.1 amino acid adenylation domain-containing protein [Phaeobacter sp. HF9A]
MSIETGLAPGLVALSPGEKQICAHDRVGQLAPYAIQRVRLKADLRWSKAQLRQAADAVIAAHPVFAARLRRRAGGTLLRSQDAADRVSLIELATDQDIESRLASARFDLEGGPGVLALLAPTQGGHMIALALHPAFGDFAVLEHIASSLAAALLGERPCEQVLAPLALPDAATQRARLDHWRPLLDGTTWLNARLPQRYNGAEDLARAEVSHRLDCGQTRAALRRGGLPLEVSLAAAVGVALMRYSGHGRLRFAVGQMATHSTRRSEDILPLCLNLDPGQRFAEAEAETLRALADARAHGLPSEYLLQDLLRRDEADRHPLGAIALHVQQETALPEGLDLLTRPEPAALGECMLLAYLRRDGALELHANYARGLFEPALIDRFLVHVTRVLTTGTQQSDLPVGRIPLLLRQELDLLSAPYEDNTENDPRPVHELIADHARLTPERTALISAGVEWSHGALNRRANRLAHRLLDLGVGAEVAVAIMVERGNEAVMAILAALKAGGAYIPLEPDHPESRNHHILTDAAAHVVITRRRYLDRLPAGTGAHILCLDDSPGAGQPESDPETTIHPDQMAYIMYTSGSTGKPKGVAVEHGPLSHHLQDTARVYEMSRDSRELPFLPFSSDGGHERWMNPLMMGGSAVIPDGPLWTPEQSFAAMRTYGCNNASIPTTYLQQLAEWAADTGEAPDMRLYSFGGEGLAQTTFDLLSRELRAPLLINGYGPTETIMTPMVWKVRAGTRFDGAYAPLGRAVGNRRAYVLDERMMPCPIGVAGEIHLGGEGVARGYVNRPGTTADRFIPDPFGPQLDGRDGARLYRSGDLGRWREDGTIEFLGRVDLQVKLNGYRIEPGEIEAALLAQPGVSEALVLLREDDGEKRLVGYVVAPPEVQEEDLMRALESGLPKHMLPSAIVVLERMPVNPNAKLDRAALPLPGRRHRASAGVAATGATEADILAIWQQEIGNPEMGVTDDFFAMGGKSLTALKVLTRMRRHWPGVALTIADLFDAPTVRSLARRIAQGDATGRQAITLRGTGTGSKPMLYCFPGLLVSTREYMRLTDYLGDNQPVTGFLCHSLNEEKRLNVSVSEVVAGYVAHIRAESAGRPCAFLGWSWGGLLAWEAARQLRGEVDIRMIGMVDVCDLGSDFAPGAVPDFAPGERARLEAEMRDWLRKTRMRAQWEALIAAMDGLCYDQFLRFIGNEAEPLPCDGPEVSSREHTFWVLIDNALVFRQYQLAQLDVPVASFSAGDSLSRGLNLVDWRRYSSRASAAAVVPGTNHLHIIGDQLFHARFKAALDAAMGG